MFSIKEKQVSEVGEGHAMGEVQNSLFGPEFNLAVKVQATDYRFTPDAGVVLLREADHRTGLLVSIAAGIRDPGAPDQIG